MRSVGHALLLVWALALSASAAGPADELLRLTPPNAGAVLVVEDLRGHEAALLKSAFARELQALPVTKAWRESEAFGKFVRARGEIESALKTNLGAIRDDLLGDAVVMVLQPGPGNDPTAARGLMLSRVRDRELLDRVVAFVNASESRDGALSEVLKRDRGGVAYQNRRFKPGTKPDEWYTILENGTFAWSNSQALIHGVIDRSQGSGNGLLDEPLFSAARAGLPARCLASLYIDPRFAERILSQASAASGSPTNPAAALAFGHYVKSLKYVAAGVEWREGLFVHLHEIHDPALVPKILKNWAVTSQNTEATLPALPPDMLAVATTTIDFPAIAEAMISLAPEAQRARIENGMAVVSGILYGKDLRREVLPRLGPAVWLVARAPSGGDVRPEFTLNLRIGRSKHDDSSNLAPALDNGLKTLLAMLALDAKHGNGQEHVTTRVVHGVSVTSLSGEKTPFAYAIADGRWLTLGTTREAVASQSGARAENQPTEFTRVRASDFPDADTFAFADLKAIADFATTHRAAFARRLAQGRGGSQALAEHDLDQALALIGLFRSAFVVNRVESDYSSAHQVLGIRPRDAEKRP